jgi:hypothetical protein
MPHILRRHRKTVTTETWTIVWSKEGLSVSGEMPAELPLPDQLSAPAEPPALPEPSAFDDSETSDQDHAPNEFGG